MGNRLPKNIGYRILDYDENTKQWQTKFVEKLEKEPASEWQNVLTHQAGDSSIFDFKHVDILALFDPTKCKVRVRKIVNETFASYFISYEISLYKGNQLIERCRPASQPCLAICNNQGVYFSDKPLSKEELDKVLYNCRLINENSN